jgi:phosphoglucomutase
MTLDHEDKICMDCSNPCAMARLVQLKDRSRLAFDNDPDSDRDGIVMSLEGLMNPNHYLAVALDYLLTHRPDWRAETSLGKTVASSRLIERVIGSLGGHRYEVPVGYNGSPWDCSRARCALVGRGVLGQAYRKTTGRPGRSARTDR